MAEIDALLQTVMFTIYGNQYESREEHLLLTMFQSVLTYQFDHTPEYSSLLRANTPVSRMMTTYTRRGPGQSYLKEVLSREINSLIELCDLDLEINPLKVYERMIDQIEDKTGSRPVHLPKAVTAEQAAENQRVQEIIAPRLTKLTKIATDFLDTIIKGLDETPYGIRWICKQIRSLSKVASISPRPAPPPFLFLFPLPSIDVVSTDLVLIVFFFPLFLSSSANIRTRKIKSSAP